MTNTTRQAAYRAQIELETRQDWATYRRAIELASTSDWSEALVTLAEAETISRRCDYGDVVWRMMIGQSLLHYHLS